MQSIPFDKLDADARAKINSVLSSTSVYRRLPTRTVNCDPDLYLFLVRHPDTVVNIWELLGVAQIQLRQTDIDTFRVAEDEGTSASLEFLYHSNDLQIAYGKWTYTGPLLARKITGRCLALVRTEYAKDAGGKYYITAQHGRFPQRRIGCGRSLGPHAAADDGQERGRQLYSDGGFFGQPVENS